MKMELDFLINDPPDPFHEATRFVIGFALPFDGFQRRPGKNCERALVDDLISCIKFRHDEVNRGSVCQHSMLIGIFVRAKTRKRRQQPVMQVDDAASKLPARAGGKDSHVAGQDNVIDVVLIEEFNHPLIVGVSFGVADHVPVDIELLGHATAVIPVANHDGWRRV